MNATCLSKCSIVIPTFNSTPTILRTLKSIESPSIEIEILLIDDVSADVVRLRQIAAADGRIRLIEKEKKTNAADSRDIGMRMAANDIVFFLDSDDRFEGGYIAHRLSIFATSSCSVVFGRFKIDDGTGARAFTIPHFAGQDFGEYIFGMGGDCRSSTIALDRRRLNGTVFDAALAQHQDWAFAIAMQRNGEAIAFDPQAGVIIDVARDARMSRRMRTDASLVFMTNYLGTAVARQGFLFGRVKAASKIGDVSAAKWFYERLRFEAPPAALHAKAFGLVVANRLKVVPMLNLLVRWRKRRQTRAR